MYRRRILLFGLTLLVLSLGGPATPSLAASSSTRPVNRAQGLETVIKDVPRYAPSNAGVSGDPAAKRSNFAPEPAALGLFGTMLVGLAGLARWKTRRRA